MTVFDLVFIACFLVAMVALVRAGYHASRRRWASSSRVLTRLGFGAAIYAGILVAVSLSSRQKVLRMGERQCFDEWCVSVERVVRLSQVGDPTTVAHARGIFWVVTVRVSNAGAGGPSARRMLDYT